MIMGIATLTVTCVIILSLAESGNCYFSALAYKEPDYAGLATSCDYVCNVKETISIQLISGSCMQILDKSGRLITYEEDIPNTGYYYEGQLSACPFHSKTIECPIGTFVKQVEWSNKSALTDGVKMSCSEPESDKLVEASGSSSSKMTHKMNCPALKKLVFRRDIRKDSDVEVAMTTYCNSGNITKVDSSLECQSLTAISGVTFSIESKTSYIKKSSPICSHVPNISAKCKVKDEKQKLQLSSNTMKTVGVGHIPFSDMTDEEKNEFNFYTKFQFETEHTLSTNFKNNLAVSSTTSYDWRSAPESTWQKEQQISIQIEKSENCKTEIFEIVGRCSYMTIRPYYLERVDHCSVKSYRTIQDISHSIHKRSYISKMPVSIKNIIN